MATSTSLAMLCLAGLGGLPAQAGKAVRDPDIDGIELKLLEAPTSRRADPRALRYIVDHLPPGTIIRRRVVVKNNSPEPQRIALYPAAATLDKEKFQFGAGRAANDLTSWISLDRTELDLPARSEATARVTIQVPPTAPSGERYAVIWAEVASPPDPSTSVNLVHRVGIRVYLDIGIGGEPASDFTIGELIPARSEVGQPAVAIKVHNTGGRALDMTGSVDLSDGPAGMRAGPFDVVKGTTLAPGASGTVNALFPNDLPNGPWRIEVNLQSGLVQKTAVGEVTFPNPGETGRPGKLFAPLDTPWRLISVSLVVGLVVLAGLILVIRRSRRRRILKV